MISVTDEPANRRGRPTKAAVPPARDIPTASVAPPSKRGQGRPKMDAAMSVQEPPTTSVAPPTKRGPGRPKKDPAQVAPAPRRTIIQPDEKPPHTTRSIQKRPFAFDDTTNSQVIAGALKTRGQQKLSAKFVFESPEPPEKKQRRGLTNIFTSPVSSSMSPVAKAIDSTPHLSRPDAAFESDTSQPAPKTPKASVQVEQPKRRTIVQLDEKTVARNIQAELSF